MSKNIWIIDEQHSYREGLKSLLEVSLKNCSVTTYSFIDLSNTDKLPDLIIIEPSFDFKIHLSDIDLLLEKNISVVILSLESSEKRILKILQKNIQGYLVKSMESPDFIKSIKEILTGQKYIHPQIANVLFNEYQRNKKHYTLV